MSFEHDVEMEDVLSAMAESLVETQSLFKVREIPDPQRTLTTGLKPPKEIFYRNSVIFMTQLPPPIHPKICSCLYLCTGAKATIKCLSCAIYDIKKIGYYCDRCFNARHPWYRVPHIYSSIDKDENIQYTLNIQNRCAQAARLETEGNEILEKTRYNISRTEKIGDDVEVDTKLRLAARKTTTLENRMREIKKMLRKDVRSSGQFIPIDEDEASVIISKVFKGFYMRRIISLIIAERTLCVWDSNYGRDFYYDKKTQTSSWTPPRFLLKIHFSKLETLKDETRIRKWCLKPNVKSKIDKNKISSKDSAQKVLAGFCRCILARNRILNIAKNCFRRVFEPESETYFYYNTQTGVTSWERPKIFLSDEPPILMQHDENPESRIDKISPRYNRESFVKSN